MSSAAESKIDPGGDIPRPESLGGYYRKIIQIKATDSPNVKYGLWEQQQGLPTSDTIIIPGVKPYGIYLEELATMDPIKLTVTHGAEFYEGAEVKMFPPVWLTASQEAARGLNPDRPAVTIGIDPAEGGALTALVAVDRKGVIDIEARKTPDTTVIPSMILAFARKHRVTDPQNWLIDRGFGYSHACTLRKQGYRIRTVAFGESVTPMPRRGTTQLEQRKIQQEERYAFLNRRAEMYWLLREAINPGIIEGKATRVPFAIPTQYVELLRQLKPIPIEYDGEGRLRLPPKQAPREGYTGKTMTQLIGCSPDHTDALVLAHYGLTNKQYRPNAGSI